MANTVKKHIDKTSFFGRLFSDDHRHIGSCYIGFAIFAGLLGAVFSLILRLELNGYKAHFFGQFLNSLYSDLDKSYLLSMLSIGHALIMIFFMMLPALIGGFANWMVPYLIGTDDVAFPKLNRFAFWLLIPALLILVGSIFFQPLYQSWVVMIAIHICGVSLLCSFIIFIATIITMRTPGMSLIKMPVFVWSVLVASFLGVMCLPIMLATTLIPNTMTLSGSENLPILLWFLMHPESYVLLLPAFGIMSQIISTFSARSLFAERGVVAAMLVIGLSGFVLWAENVFVISSSAGVIKYFSLALPLIGLPICFILMSWVVTLVTAKLKFETPLLWALGGVFITFFGVLSVINLFMNHYILSTTIESTFVGHFHYVVSLSVVFAIFAGWYYWFPKVSGFVVRRVTGTIHFVMMFTAVNMIFLPQYLGYSNGSSELAVNLVDSFNGWNMVSVSGTWLAALSLIVFVYSIFESLVRQQKAGANPWGKGANTLEWQLPSTPSRYA